jgi:hypothetical protein
MNMIEFVAFMVLMVGTMAVIGTVWLVAPCVPLRDLLMVARATHSPRACLEFVWFCTKGR